MHGIVDVEEHLGNNSPAACLLARTRTKQAMRRRFIARRCRWVMWMSSMMAMASKHWHK
jgi:hypothetical protein